MIINQGTGQTPTEITINSNSTYIASLGGYSKVVKLGRLVIVSLNFSTAQVVPTGSTLLTGLPAPFIQVALSVAGNDGSSARLGLSLQGEVQADGGLNYVGWYNGNFSYISIA